MAVRRYTISTIVDATRTDSPVRRVNDDHGS